MRIIKRASPFVSSVAVESKRYTWAVTASICDVAGATWPVSERDVTATLRAVTTSVFAVAPTACAIVSTLCDVAAAVRAATSAAWDSM